MMVNYKLKINCNYENILLFLLVFFLNKAGTEHNCQHHSNKQIESASGQTISHDT